METKDIIQDLVLGRSYQYYVKANFNLLQSKIAVSIISLSEEALQIPEKRRETKGKGEKET